MSRAALVPRLLLVLTVAGIITAFFALGLQRYLTLAAAQAHLHELTQLRDRHPVRLGAAYMAAYILFTSLSIPGAVFVTLTGGALFGLWPGVALTSFSASLGATLSMLGSRYLFRDIVKRHFPARTAQADRGLQRSGWVYLASLRLVPLMPYVLINLVFGVTALPAWEFFIVSQIFMMPAEFVYVNAGTQLEHLDSVANILSPSVLVSLLLLALLPVTSRWVVSLWRRGA